MHDFSHLSKLNVSRDKTAEFKMVMIEGTPTLLVRPATDANKPYLNASLKRSKSSVRSIRGGTLTADMLNDTRDSDRVLYAAHIVTGWKGLKDAKGKDVPFSKEACEGFLGALPNWIFDDLREFCGTPGNFLEEDLPDSEDVAKK